MYKHFEWEWYLFFQPKKTEKFYWEIMVLNTVWGILPFNVICDIHPVVPWTTVLVIGVSSIPKFFNN